MKRDYGEELCQLRVDGGPTANDYLMQFQSDIADMEVLIPELQELSGMGAAYMAGISEGIYPGDAVFEHIHYSVYQPTMPTAQREKRRAGWKNAIRQTLTHP